jgi:Flp pilus assembly protein TadG
MWRAFLRLLASKEAAIAPTAALSLFGLIAAGGIAFDYARLATMDTELQQAADQAALAAATQLDRTDGAQTRAETAIQDADNTKRLSRNITRFANDAAGNGVEIASVTFCSEFDDSVADTATACTEADGDSDSRFVVVTTELRTARYAFTPIVAALSGTISASAVAGISSSICNIAPMMVCAPGTDWPTSTDKGKGLLMKVAGGNEWAPGNYGLLDFGPGNPGAIDALLGHGLNGCQGTDSNQTEPGNKNVTDAINTRMDVYGGTGATKSPSVCNLSTGYGCPADNTRKDMTLTMTYTKTTAQTVTTAPPDDQSCGATGGTVTYGTSFAQNTSAKGFPRDSCHYSGTCAGGNIGDGTWDITAYLAANHSGITADAIAASLGGGRTAATLTRYDVYTWELANKATAMSPFQVGLTSTSWKDQGKSNRIWTYTKQCNFPKPKLASSNYPAERDRRVLAVVSADCSNLKGKGSAFTDYAILRVFDVFITEPSLTRAAPTPTDDKEIYGEVIGPSEAFGGASGFQYYSRNKPYLVR